MRETRNEVRAFAAAPRPGRRPGSSRLRKTVLISEPQLPDVVLKYLPLMWGILKTYWERHGDGAIDWLAPIYRLAPAATLLETHRERRIDVLGLSCYTWNWMLQCAIAERVKRANPECLVVAGGPDPDYKDPTFFAKYPYIDMIAVKDGEITFANILERVLGYEDDGEGVTDPALYADIPGLYLPNPGGNHICTGPAEVPLAFEDSPYIAQSAFYERLRESVPLPGLVAIWETNRGCPYSCSFCDWGSNTMSKLRRFDMERIKAEADWFGRTKINVVNSADANFGILPQDLEIADLLIAAHEKYGFPSYFTYNTAKNNPDRTVAIAKKIVAAGLASSHVLSIQHTDNEVLAATDRANIPADKQVEVVRQLMADRIPIYVQLILGIPGDTYARWKACFADLMEWGIHTYYWVYLYQLLPNAPAAEPNFMKKWAVETVDRYFFITHGARERRPIDPQLIARSRLIVQTCGFTRDDWVRMQVYAEFIKALHCCGVTQSIAVYLRFTHGVPYGAFYDAMIEEFCAGHAPAAHWYAAVTDHCRAFLDHEDALEFMDVTELPSSAFQLDASRWLYFKIGYQVDRFFESLSVFLGARFPAITTLASLCDYQKNLIILPRYDRSRGTTFFTDYDWVAYFDRAHRMTEPERLDEPEATPGGIVRVSDQAWSDEGVTFALDWGPGSDEARWIGWLKTNAVGRNSVVRNNFQKLQLHRLLYHRSVPALGYDA